MRPPIGENDPNPLIWEGGGSGGEKKGTTAHTSIKFYCEGILQSYQLDYGYNYFVITYILPWWSSIVCWQVRSPWYKKNAKLLLPIIVV